MNKLSDERVVELLRTALVRERRADPPELWPRMRRRLDESAVEGLTIDWVLAIAAVVLCLLQPSVLSVLLLHF